MGTADQTGEREPRRATFTGIMRALGECSELADGFETTDEQPPISADEAREILDRHERR